MPYAATLQLIADWLKRFPRLRHAIINNKLAQSGYRLARHYMGGLQLRPCHIHQLFVNSAGDIFPCCLIWMHKDMIICNVRDRDLKNKLRHFSAHCSCERYRFRAASKNETIQISNINLELDLACQAECVMCCIGAPKLKNRHWKYDLYEDLSILIMELSPASLTVQGGEVLIQKKSLKWLDRIKSEQKTIAIHLVTNGNATTDMIPTVNRLFDAVTVSFVGFQEYTYRTIMGLNLSKTVHFISTLSATDKHQLTLKFLVTPSNIHEMSAFLSWALTVKPSQILFSDAKTERYINMKRYDDYWSEIVFRTGRDIVRIVKEYRQTQLTAHTVLSIETPILRLFSQSKVATDEELKALFSTYLL